MERRAAFATFAQAQDGRCLVLSPDPFLDGRCLPLQDAVREAAACFDAVLILGSNYAVVFGEAGKGGREKYLLVAPGSETG